MDYKVFFEMFREKYGEFGTMERCTLIQAVSIFEEILKNVQRQERVAIIAELREWAKNNQYGDALDYGCVSITELYEKLDSMEAQR